jgi:L-alanine-DL-glutamate epimerase-like enolase superfamily enzyme
MKIVKIETEVKKIPLKTPFITALRRVENVEFVRVTMTCESGVVGIGEAPATKAITGEGIEEILASIKSVRNILNFHMPSDALELLHEHRGTDHPICTIGSSAKAALDMALHSLIAQSQNIPMYQYLGAEESIALQTDVTISLNDVQTMVEDAKRACGSGMWILKIKLGEDIEHAIEVVQTISKELPHVPERSDKCPWGAKLIIDANQAWHVEGTMRFIDALRGVAIELIEQPVIAKDLEGLKKITEYSDIPILADEAVFTLEDAKKVIQTKSADMINIKLMKCGGVTKAIEILQYCRANNVKCMLGSMLEGPYSINIALHLAMAYSDVIQYIDLDSPLLYKEMSDALEFTFSGCNINYR